MPDQDYGPLAAALAKAQAAFPPISRDKEVTVQLKTGGSYKFKYAPLEKILSDTRQALTANGLAIAQLIDADPDGMPYLTTKLLHASGAFIEGRTPIPHADGETVQAFGSAITYLRRYAIQALLGIAAEEDDDGNAASGNQASFGGTQSRRKQNGDDGLTGTVGIGTNDADMNLRQMPDDTFRIGFKLMSNAGGIKVMAVSPLAEQIEAHKAKIVGARVTCWGRITDESYTPKPKPGAKEYTVTYQVLALERIRVPDVGDLPRVFSADDEAELDRAAG